MVGVHGLQESNELRPSMDIWSSYVARANDVSRSLKFPETDTSKPEISYGGG